MPPRRDSCSAPPNLRTSIPLPVATSTARLRSSVPLHVATPAASLQTSIHTFTFPRPQPDSRAPYLHTSTSLHLQGTSGPSGLFSISLCLQGASGPSYLHTSTSLRLQRASSGPYLHASASARLHRDCRAPRPHTCGSPLELHTSIPPCRHALKRASRPRELHTSIPHVATLTSSL